MLPNEAWGRPRDKERLPDPLGVAHWTQEIYYHALSAGLRIPPSAGSASGVLPNPVGYNRVYVHVGESFTHESWWQGLAAGRCLVTNGPLVVCRAGGELPGHVFKTEEPVLTLPLQLALTSRDPVRGVEVIHNGAVIQTVGVGDATSHDLTAELKLEASGWFLVRAIAENDETFRFGSTGPFYVEIGAARESISRRSCEFFQQWVLERIARVRENLPDEDQRRAVLAYHEEALAFWRARADRATAP
jgi:hypothetical protein